MDSVFENQAAETGLAIFTPGTCAASRAAAEAVPDSAGDHDERRSNESEPRVSADCTAPTRLFGITVFSSAFLGFSLQPMIGRLILPQFGGATAVWSTSLLFFQTTLLAAYGYAHVVTTWLSIKRSAAVHLGVALLPLLLLPIAVPLSGWSAPAEHGPVFWVLGCLLATAGAPFFVVSTSGPLLQRWFAATDQARGRDPYFLYAASNVGSLAGLLSYPILLEPAFGLRQQSSLWGAGYLLLAGLIGCCAVAVWRRASPAADKRHFDGETAGATAAVGFATRLRWLTLAFVPSSLLAGVTAFLSADISPIPLLWVIPLSLYLLTFVVAFGRARPRTHRWLTWALPLVIVLPLVHRFISNDWNIPLPLEILLHLGAFTAICMVFHGELSRRRPAASRLTEYYLWISLGGVLGGAFNALIAPLVFSTLIEYKLMLAVAGLTMPAWHHCWPWALNRRREAIAVVVFGMLVSLSWWLATGAFCRYGVPLLASAVILPRRWLFSPAAWAIYSLGVFAVALPSGYNASYQGRSFYGTFCVIGDAGGQFFRLVHGRTLHGAQWLDGPNRRIPVSYYDPTGPVGAIFGVLRIDATRHKLDHVALIGLGTGTLAAYGRSGEEFTFFEIDPAMEQLARNQFSYLEDSSAACRVVLGDARLSIAREPDHKYALIVLDAFNSDSVPSHLLTREAIELYRDKLAEHGLIAIHLSNIYVDLEPVVFELGKAIGLQVRTWNDMVLTPAANARGKLASRWAVLARSEEDLGLLNTDSRWQRVCRRKAGLWTDDYSNILGVLDLNPAEAERNKAR